MSSYEFLIRITESVINERLKCDLLYDNMYMCGEAFLDVAGKQRFANKKDCKAVKRMQRHFARKLYKRGHYEFIDWMPFWRIQQWWDSNVRKLY